MERVFHISASFAEAEKWDIRQHREMTADARLDAVEFLREQCWIAAGLKNVPRIQKTGRIVEAEKIPASWKHLAGHEHGAEHMGHGPVAADRRTW